MKKALTHLLLLVLCQPLFAQEWVVELPQSKVSAIRDMVPVDSGEYVLGIGTNYQGNGLVLKVGKDGQYSDRLVHLPGMTLQYHSAVQLENGNYMVFGICDDSLRDPLFQQYLQVDVFDDKLESVSSRTYDVDDEAFDFFFDPSHNYMMKSILSKSGTAILACLPTFFREEPYPMYCWMLRFYEFDEAGDLVRMVDDVMPTDHINEIFYAPHSDNLMITVIGTFPPNDATGIYIADTSLNIIARKDFFHLYGGINPYADHIWEARCEGRWFDNDNIIFDAYTIRYDGKDDQRPTFYYDKLFKLDSALNVHAELRLPPYDSCSFSPDGTTTAYIDDSTIFAFTCSSLFVNSLDMQQLNITLVDKDLNLLGRKVLRTDDVIYATSSPAAFNDGGCLVYVGSWNGEYYPGEPFKRKELMKFRRADIEITWDVVQESETPPQSSPYPNPANGILNIPISEGEHNGLRLQIFDMKGEKCFDCAITKQGNLITVDTQNFEVGLYVYHVISDNKEISSGKFVKE